MRNRTQSLRIGLTTNPPESEEPESTPSDQQILPSNWKTNAYLLRSYVALLESERSHALNALRMLEKQESSSKMISQEPLGSLRRKAGEHQLLPLTSQNQESISCKFLISKEHLIVLRHLYFKKKWMVSKYQLRVGSIIEMTLDGLNLSIR